ncbi:MAG: BTAD domain-containing putative transcriptional regulator [Actinomycetota bacterium]|nr:BTAD domain-containing putative transcriptional regulator [Actinomycetota bacterium]
MTTINDLGPLAVDGEAIGGIVASPPQRLLLAALTVAHPGPVSTARLLETLWPGEDVEPRRLWTHVFRLRRALATRNEGADVIVRNGDAYALTGDVIVDSRRFDELVDAADEGRSPPEVMSLLNDAIGLWRGDAYEDVDIERLAPGVAVRLAERRVHALVERARAVMEVRGPDQVVADLDALAAIRPYDESVAELLANALHRAGRRVDALRALRAFTGRLADDTGLEPGPGLRALEATVLGAGTAIETTPPCTTGPCDGGELSRLPRWRTSFVGRDAAIDELCGLLGGERLVTVVGPGGVGKTRFAVEALRTLDGRLGPIAFADLTEVGADAPIERVVLDAVGAGGEADGSHAATLAMVRRRAGILLLDNCEHVVERVADLVDGLLGETCTTRVLATSREPIRIDGECVVDLSPLDVDDGGSAVRLFFERAGLTNSACHRDVPAVVEICRRLDGLPLAIELAAARSGSLPLADLASALDDRFALLTTGNRSGPSRHRTLEAAIGWSWDLLSPRTKDVLAGCAAFAGHFSADDAVSLCIGERHVPASVADLVDRRLVQRRDQHPPYRLLESVRSFGRAELERSERSRAAADRHAEHFRNRAVVLAADAFGPCERDAVDCMLAQSAEYRAATSHARAQGAWELLADLVNAIATTTFWGRGAWMEVQRSLPDILDELPRSPPPGWADVLASVASAQIDQGRFRRADEIARRAIEIDAESALAWGQASFAVSKRDPTTALHRAERAVALSRPERYVELKVSRSVLAYAARAAGDRERARAVAEDLLADARRVGSQTAESFALFYLARGWPTASQEFGRYSREAYLLALEAGMNHMWAALQHVEHLLHDDLDAARAALAEYLAVDWRNSIFERRLLGAVASYYVISGNLPSGRELCRAIGRRFFLAVERPEVAESFADLPADPPVDVDNVALIRCALDDLERRE